MRLLSIVAFVGLVSAASISSANLARHTVRVTQAITRLTALPRAIRVPPAPLDNTTALLGPRRVLRAQPVPIPLLEQQAAAHAAHRAIPMPQTLLNVCPSLVQLVDTSWTTSVAPALLVHTALEAGYIPVPAVRLGPTRLHCPPLASHVPQVAPRTPLQSRVPPVRPTPMRPEIHVLLVQAIRLVRALVDRNRPNVPFSPCLILAHGCLGTSAALFGVMEAEASVSIFSRPLIRVVAALVWREKMVGRSRARTAP
ncbi:hypothetical protein FRC12_002294 [Ceratobasidium sp. 428]|nr:hypothetical protein FRC12_002294 [Ceratobasidium sp. 428]